MNICKHTAIAIALLSTSVANAAIISDYDKSVASSDGWTIVYQGGYGTNFNYASVLGSIATGSQVALASSASASVTTFDLFAATSLNTLQTITSINSTVFSNNTYWYRNDSSVGFAPSAYIYQTSADVVGAGWGYGDDLNDGDLRLSWHGGSTDVDGGWRSGNNTSLNSDNTWQRYILVKSELADQNVPEPASIALFGLGIVGLAAMRRRMKTR